MASIISYETVVGLEVHVQLLTRSKLFAGDSTNFGAEPNTQVSPITLAHPGTLPRMNKKAIEYAVRMGLACNCEIERNNFFARKNYFYPDLPKGYQVSQHTTPICKGGHIVVTAGGGEKTIRLNRIHLEEDAGKSIHDVDPLNTCIDYNRAGTPLIEIVTEPDIRSADEAFAFVTEIRKLVRYLGICDGNMEEGSLRCDANISVRPTGEAKLGTKVEIKNLNSIRNVKRAIEHESQRLIQLLESGGEVTQQTRGFNADNGTTYTIRDKEDADDYRYFADPDLLPFDIDNGFIELIRKSVPALPAQRILDYTSRYQLPEYDARVITEEKEVAEYFEQLIEALHPAGNKIESARVKAAANWIIGPIRSWMNDSGSEVSSFPVEAGTMAELISLVESGKVSFSAASSRLFPHLLSNPGTSPEAAAEQLELFQQSGSDFLDPVITQVLEKHAAKVTEYKKGKKGLLALFVGEVMKQSKGKADPKMTTELILKKLSS